MAKVNLLLLAVLAVHLLAMVTIGADAGFDFKDIFKKKEDKNKNAEAAPTTDAAAEDEQQVAPRAAHRASGSRAEQPKRTAAKQDSSQVRRSSRRQDQVNLRDAEEEEEAAPVAQQRAYPKRLNLGGGGGAATGAHGRRRHFMPEPELDEKEDEQGEEQEEEGLAPVVNRRQVRGRHSAPPPQEPADEEPEPEGPAGGSAALMGRFKNKQTREQLAARFVNTHRDKAAGAEGASGKPTPLSFMISNSKALGAKGELPEKKHSKSKWLGKQWNKALDKTKRGLKASAEAMAELPSKVAAATDTINAFLQLDGKGKLLSMIDEVEGDIHFVRKEFSQFTLSWSPIMEQALNYLGDTKLDRLKFDERDELDLKKDALHSLAIGYEFMRVLVAWREQLLMAHEAYKLWLESLKSEYENKHFEISDGLIMQLGTIHKYLLLISWEEIEARTFEARAKLDYLMEFEDERPKNYESDYFRNIIVLQEMYFPTAAEMDKEQEEVRASISESGAVVDNLEQVDEFYDNFRRQLETRELDSVDCKVPDELIKSMDKLKPQLESNALVYPKSFLKELEKQSVAREQQQQQ